MFANQRELGDDALRKYAADVGLDVASFGECLSSGRFAGDVAADLKEGERFGVTGTPAFFVNGRFLSGNQPFEAFARIIEDELESKGIATN